MSQKGTHLCEDNTLNISTMKKSQQNSERSILEGLYMDCASRFKIEWIFVSQFVSPMFLKLLHIKL
jgi:hypothetical protein